MDLEDEQDRDITLEELQKSLQRKYDEVKSNEHRLSNLRRETVKVERAIKDGVEAARVIRVMISNVTTQYKIKELEAELEQLRQQLNTES